MSDRYQFWAYIATLSTLVIVFVSALIAAALQPSLIGRLEAFGLGTITGGLIGVLRLPQRPASPLAGDSPQPVTVTNPDSDPVPVAAKE